MGLEAVFTVLEGGSTYHAQVEVVDTESHAFHERGVLGERIPLVVENISVRGAEGQVAFEKPEPSLITFPRGDYLINYSGTIRDNTLQAEFEDPTDVTVYLPPGLDVRNPLIGMVSQGGTAEEINNSVLIRWEDTQLVECRFYEPGRERGLYIFGTFWLALCAILLIPFLLSRGRRGG
ncbi:MAG: DUF5803 family protein [Methanomicrobiaceae archaeon]|nr:DUF5803 family protein [Methanomicrobiaceae archaeon]